MLLSMLTVKCTFYSSYIHKSINMCELLYKLARGYNNVYVLYIKCDTPSKNSWISPRAPFKLQVSTILNVTIHNIWKRLQEDGISAVPLFWVTLHYAGFLSIPCRCFSIWSSPAHSHTLLPLQYIVQSSVTTRHNCMQTHSHTFLCWSFF